MILANFFSNQVVSFNHLNLNSAMHHAIVANKMIKNRKRGLESEEIVQEQQSPVRPEKLAKIIAPEEVPQKNDPPRSRSKARKLKKRLNPLTKEVPKSNFPCLFPTCPRNYRKKYSLTVHYRCDHNEFWTKNEEHLRSEADKIEFKLRNEHLTKARDMIMDKLDLDKSDNNNNGDPSLDRAEKTQEKLLKRINNDISKPFQCHLENCFKSYNYKYDLTRHFKSVHTLYFNENKFKIKEMWAHMKDDGTQYRRAPNKMMLYVDK